jgi:hypothetical protein
VRSGAAVALGTELNFWIIKNHAALETSEVCSLCTVVYHDARMKKKILIFFPKTGHFEHIIRHEISLRVERRETQQK